MSKDEAYMHEINRLEGERDHYKRRAELLAEELRKSRNTLGVIRSCLTLLEWAGRLCGNLGPMTCLWCRRTPPEGHRSECLVGKMLLEIEP